MADIIDAANELTDLNMLHALANRPPPVPLTGKCRNCDEAISTGNFCDAECRTDYEKRVKRGNYYG